jgi:nicotinate-nucleotide pyrophosphorylase (carboxylating)
MTHSRPLFGESERTNAETLISLALAEDLNDAGDLTTTSVVPARARGTARLVARAPGVVAGLPVVGLLMDRFELGAGWRPLRGDGDHVQAGDVLGELSGPFRSILTLERTALNFVQRLSGVATLTARFVALVEGTKAGVYDTRKTTPGWRALGTYAVRCGGGRNHRIGLYDAVLIKDNHLGWLRADGVADPIARAIADARTAAPPGAVVEGEVDTRDQRDAALAQRPDVVLVDNFDPEALREAVRRRDLQAQGVELEASGGVNLETIAAIARSGVDRISVGALTHSAVALDAALDIDIES